MLFLSAPTDAKLSELLERGRDDEEVARVDLGGRSEEPRSGALGGSSMTVGGAVTMERRCDLRRADLANLQTCSRALHKVAEEY